MHDAAWKIGELARLTGLSVRALRYYEEIGLLRASGRTEGNHRLYGTADLARLQQILSLRQLGFALEDVQACLDDPAYAIGPLVAMHVARLEAEIALKQRAHQRLTALRAQLEAEGAVPVSHILASLEASAMLDRYLTPEQVKKVHDSHSPSEDGRRERLRDAWHAIFAEAQRLIDAGADPASAPAQALAASWRALVHESTNGDAAMAANVARMYEERPETRARVGMSDAVWAYASEALAAEG